MRMRPNGTKQRSKKKTKPSAPINRFQRNEGDNEKNLYPVPKGTKQEIKPAISDDQTKLFLQPKRLERADKTSLPAPRHYLRSCVSSRFFYVSERQRLPPPPPPPWVQWRRRDVWNLTVPKAHQPARGRCSASKLWQQ